MNVFKKTYWLINPILVVVFMLLLDKFSHMEDIGVKAVISVSLAYILSPKVKIVDKNHGEEEQIKWLFFKKVINKQL